MDTKALHHGKKFGCRKKERKKSAKPGIGGIQADRGNVSIGLLQREENVNTGLAGFRDLTQQIWQISILKAEVQT